MVVLQQSAWDIGPQGNDDRPRAGHRPEAPSGGIRTVLRGLDRAGTLAMQLCVYAVLIWLGAAFVRHGTETLHLLVHGPGVAPQIVATLPLPLK